MFREKSKICCAVAVSAVWHFQDKTEANKLRNIFLSSFICKLFYKSIKTTMFFMYLPNISSIITSHTDLQIGHVHYFPKLFKELSRNYDFALLIFQ